MSFLLATMLLVSPPLEGDQRTEILDAVNELLASIGTGNKDDMVRALDGEGTTYIHDLRQGTEPVVTVQKNAYLIDRLARRGDQKYEEKIGVPTVLQRNNLGQVWAPYYFAIDGKISHCGIDNFSLAKRDDKWIVTNLGFTMEPPETCAEIGAPEVGE